MNRDALKSSSISVTIRVRPFTVDEQASLIKARDNPFFITDGSLQSQHHKSEPLYSPQQVQNIIRVMDHQMLIFDPPVNLPNLARMGEHRFIFDSVFDVHASQDDVYKGTAEPLLSSVLEGFNSTVFAYGATGCGKTHTILGTPSEPGVIFLMLTELYKRLDEMKDSKIAEISVLFLEIYNESIKDLLDPSTNPKHLIIQENANQHTLVSNLLAHSPALVDEVMQLIVVGNANRTTSPTEANATSSRSHAVLQINIMQKCRTADIEENHISSTLSIIDLAGLERAASTRNRGARLQEGANINRLLLALGNCINALCDTRRRNHIPYRDSKLTRLLKFSLGGNCKTVMIVCISPLSKHHDETYNTLKYADRAKNIRTKAVRNQHSVNRHVKAYLKLIHEQKQEIEELRERECLVLNRDKEHRILLQKEIDLELSSLREQLLMQVQEKWRRYFILAKRKYLFLRRIQILSIAESLNASLKELANQCAKHLDSQMLNLESEYSKNSVFDYLLNENCVNINQRLCAHRQWDLTFAQYFEQSVEVIKLGLERDYLFSSSILFEHLMVLLTAFQVNSLNETENLEETLHLLVSGKFDYEIEQCALSFMHTHMKEKRMPLEDEQNSILGGRFGSLDSSVMYMPRRKRQGMTEKTAMTSTPEHSPKRRLAQRGSWLDIPRDEGAPKERDSSMDSTVDSLGGGPPPQLNNLLSELDMTLVSPPLPLPSSSAPSSYHRHALKEVATAVPNQSSCYTNKRIHVNLVKDACFDQNMLARKYTNHFETGDELELSPPQTRLPKLNMQACVRVSISPGKD